METIENAYYKMEQMLIKKIRWVLTKKSFNFLNALKALTSRGTMVYM